MAKTIKPVAKKAAPTKTAKAAPKSTPKQESNPEPNPNPGDSTCSVFNIFHGQQSPSKATMERTIVKMPYADALEFLEETRASVQYEYEKELRRARRLMHGLQAEIHELEQKRMY